MLPTRVEEVVVALAVVEVALVEEDLAAGAAVMAGAAPQQVAEASMVEVEVSMAEALPGAVADSCPAAVLEAEALAQVRWRAPE
jgi:hypothetical protein